MKKKKLRILQTGDLHVGKGRSSWTQNGEQMSLERAGKLFDVIYEIAHEKKCDGVLITGDIFDRKKVTNAERELVTHKLSHYSRDMPTYVIPGNHDQSDLDKSNLDFLSEVTENTEEIPNLHISRTDKHSIWELAPNFHIVGAPAPLSEDQSWVEGWAESLSELAASEDDRFVFMGHGSIKSCKRNDFGWVPEEGKDNGLSLARAAVSAPEVIFWAYGDIHIRQALPTLPPEANGWYAGSPIPMNFGEDAGRGVLILTFEHKGTWSYRGKKFVQVDDRGFIPLVTVTDEQQLDDLPEDALIRLDKGVRLSASRKKQVVSKFQVVEDASPPVIEEEGEEESIDYTPVSIDLFDPIRATKAEVISEVTPGLPEHLLEDAKEVIDAAIDKYQERTYL